MPLPQPSAAYFGHVNLEFTSVCNMTCPECSAATNGNGKRKQAHHGWGYFVEAARWLYGIEKLTIIGGEPTSSPHFAEFIPKFRQLFGCKEMILWTNGFKVEQYRDVIAANFDIVHASLYDEHTAPWNKKPNTKAIEFIKINFHNSTMEEPHVPLNERRSGELCERGIHGPITYADGKLYGCCVAVGLPGGIGITPSENWREEILKTQLPCGDCGFSPAMAA